MSTSTTTASNDTAELDAKKTDTSSAAAAAAMDWPNFIRSLIALVLTLAVYFSLSGLNLYLAKLAQANILPTDIHCEPYVAGPAATPTIQEVVCNIFYTTDPDDGRAKSQKILFEMPHHNHKHVLIDPLRKLRGNANSHFLTNYFATLAESLLQYNYGALNMYFNSLNSMPEIFVVLASPILTGIALLLIMMIEFPYFLYLWFACMSAFFRGHGPDAKPVEALSQPFNFAVACGFVMLFIVILFLIVAGVPIVNSALMLSCLLTMVAGYPAYYTDDKGGQNFGRVTAATIVRDMMRYYHGTCGGVFAAFFISNVFQFLGTMPGIVAVVVALLIWAGKIGNIPMFRSPLPPHLTQVVANLQAEKTCAAATAAAMPPTPPKGFWASWFGSPAQSGGGGAATASTAAEIVPPLDREFLRKLRRTLASAAAE